jgi:hypothetical protein
LNLQLLLQSLVQHHSMMKRLVETHSKRVSNG